MDLNPLNRTCAEIRQQIEELTRSEKQVADDLLWYTSVDPQSLIEDLRCNNVKVEVLQVEAQAFENQIQENNARISEIAPSIGTLFNPFNWFASDQIALRRTRAQLRRIGKEKAAQKQSKLDEMECTRVRIAEVTSNLQRHSTFELPRRQNELASIRQNLANKKDELEFEAERKRRVDDLLAPHIQEMDNLASRKRRAESELKVAQDFGRRLSSAGNSYDRAMIHEECERKLGDGDPRKIANQRQKEIGRIESDREKAKRRAVEIGEKAGRRIEAIIIDGNNLCYEGEGFIGLSAIEALVPLLARSYLVTVVFDSSIRRKLRSDDSGIQKHLGSHAKVHIVAPGRFADETVLDLACDNKFAYVLSNDRFGDFNEKSAVKDGRIIRHEIVNGYIFVHDLQIRTAYVLEGEESRQ